MRSSRKLYHLSRFLLIVFASSFEIIQPFRSSFQELHCKTKTEDEHQINEINLRRRVLISIPFLSILATLPDDVLAVQGAAEYDAEYYVRNLFNQNQGKPAQSISAGPPVPRARRMTLPSFILDETCSSELFRSN